MIVLRLVQNKQLMQKQLEIKKIAEGLSYSRLQLLGKGSFGEVFLGFDEARKVPCAFKVVNLPKLTKADNAENLMKKIKDEIINMQLARNPRIIQFYQAKQSPNNVYICCEYCNGESLATYIQNRKYLTEWEALRFFTEILQGFCHLRKSNIVHRDLKPANLLMHNYQIKIGDLGFSKVTEHHEQMLESVVGSPLYMSPQILDREKYTEKTDIWSLGVILYEMIYGRNPWAGSANLHQLRERIKKGVKFPEFPVVSKNIKATIRQMLVIQENSRITWENLFERYLPQHRPTSAPAVPSWVPLPATMQHFRGSLYLESRLQLPKLCRELCLLSQSEVCQLLGGYSSSAEFYSQRLFLIHKKDALNKYYDFFFEPRNEVTYLLLLLEKVLLFSQGVYLQLQIYSHSLSLLIYRYCLSIYEELISESKLVSPNKEQYQEVHYRFCHDQMLFRVLQKDQTLLKEEYRRFEAGFHIMLQKYQNHSVIPLIQKELSGIYSSPHNEKRVISFFLQNYLKKVFNIIKNILQPPHQMVSEEEELHLIDNQASRPPLDLTIARMINEYINNREFLFLTTKTSNIRNLVQNIYECQTTIREHYYQQIKQSESMMEDSIDKFMKKEIVWSQMLLSSFSGVRLDDEMNES